MSLIDNNIVNVHCPHADVNECNVGNPCNSGMCENTNGSYNCFCRVGYVFDPTGKQCVG